MAENKKTFGGKRLTPSVLNRYQKVSKLYNIPLRIVASTGATESLHGYDKRKEAKGNTQGLFHITRGAAQDVANKVLKDKQLASKISKFSKDNFRKHLLNNRDLEDKLAGGYLKMAYDEAEGDPIRTYSVYNAGVGRFNKPAHKIKPLNKQHDKNLKNYTQRYEDSFNHLNEAGEKIQKALSPLERISNMVIPGAEGAEINEENMARIKIADEMNKKKEQKKSKAPSPEFTANFLSGMDKDLGIESKEEQQIPFRPTESPFTTGVEDRETIPEVDKLEEPPQTKQEEERKGMEDGFRDALLYFGPRLGALLVGGTDAMEITDKTLKGFEESKSKKKMSPFEQASIEEKQADRELRREQIGAQQQSAQMKAMKEAEDADYLKTEQLEGIENTLSNFSHLENKLSESDNITGPVSKYMLGPMYRAADSDQANTQRMLKEIGVDALLDKIARTKGSISDSEMAVFAEAIPSMSSPEGEWRSWMSRKARALEQVHRRLKKGIILPENQRATPKQLSDYFEKAAKIRGGSLYNKRNDAPGYDPETGTFRKRQPYVETEQTKAHLDKYSGKR